MGNFIMADRETDFLFPPSMQGWLPEDHLARFVADVVDQLDLSELTRQDAGRGSQARHPAVLLGLLIYGYATVEPVFGIIKQVRGLRQFSLRGLDKVTGEWTLAILAWNVKRMNVLRLAA
jgi:hypothetical protein